MPAQRSFRGTRKPSQRLQHQAAGSTSSPSTPLGDQSSASTAVIPDPQVGASSISSPVPSHLAATDQLRAAIETERALLARNEAARAQSQEYAALQDELRRLRDANNAFSAPKIPPSAIPSSSISSSIPANNPSSSMASSASHVAAPGGIGLDWFEARRPFLHIDESYDHQPGDPPEPWYAQTGLSRPASLFLWWGLDSKTRDRYETALRSYQEDWMGLWKGVMRDIGL